MTYKVNGTEIIESDAKINWNKLVNTPAYFTGVVEDEVYGGTWGGGLKFEIEDAGSHLLALVKYDVVGGGGGPNCNCFCDGGG